MQDSETGEEKPAKASAKAKKTRTVKKTAAPAKPRRGLRGSPTLNFWLFTGPFLIGLAVFVYAPILWSLWLSFFEARFTVTPDKFVGFENYVVMLTDEDFVGSLGTFTVFAAIIVPLTWATSLGLALLVNPGIAPLGTNPGRLVGFVGFLIGVWLLISRLRPDKEPDDTDDGAVV